MNCIFCDIIADGSDVVWENDQIAVFPDKFPNAPVHLLVVPKKHIVRLTELDDVELGGELLQACVEVARERGIGGGFQVITNNGKAAGQEIDHLHFHVKGNPGPDGFSGHVA